MPSIWWTCIFNYLGISLYSGLCYFIDFLFVHKFWFKLEIILFCTEIPVSFPSHPFIEFFEYCLYLSSLFHLCSLILMLVMIQILFFPLNTCSSSVILAFCVFIMVGFFHPVSIFNKVRQVALIYLLFFLAFKGFIFTLCVKNDLICIVNSV